jgi:hypothetical protein
MRREVEHVTCRELVEVLTDYLDGVLEPAERALAVLAPGDALAARAQPQFAPTHAAVSGFIASHAAAFADDDVAAAPRELAQLADWLSSRLGL